MSLAVILPTNIPLAEAGPIPDRTVEAAIAAAEAGQLGDLSTEGAALLLYTAAPLLTELLMRRRSARIIEQLAGETNIIQLPRGEGL